ncbi:MAG: nitronate monooxygenase, partial [Burkholderiaceae bacterium]|nr:nitronate monooxygenase [Burkholderiaceae bacterium]
QAGLEPDALPAGDRAAMNFGGQATTVWRDIWGCGQGIGAVKQVSPTAELIGRLKAEYDEARRRLVLR